MCLIALLPLQELRPLREKLEGEGRCFGAVVELVVADALAWPG